MEDRDKSREELMATVAELRKLLQPIEEKRLVPDEEARRFAQQLLEHAGDGAFWIGEDARLLYVNGAACRRLGYTRAELLQMRLYDIAPHIDDQGWRSRWHQLKQGKVGTFESRHRAKDGRIVSVEITSRYLELNGIGFACSFARDIGERKRAEGDLKAAHARLQAIVDSEPECVKLLDSEGVLLEINPAGLAMLEADSPKQVLNRSIYPFVRPPHLNSFRELVAGVFRGETRGLEYEIVGLKGTTRWMESNAVPLWNERGETASLLAVARDITESRLTEQALRASEERYRELFENANDLIITIDLEGNFTSINKAAERISGYTREEALTMNIGKILAPEHLELVRATMAKRLSGQQAPTVYEVELLARDGRRVPLEISSGLSYQLGRPVGFQVVARDVTERKNLEAQVRHSQKMEAVGRLAGGVAHDFNNLLTAIIGYADLLAGEIARDSPMHADLSAIRQASERAAALTRQLLAFSRRQVLSPQVLDLNTVLLNLEKLLRRLVGVDVEVVIIPEPVLDRIKADPGQVEQILMNLAANARDAMPGGGRLLIQTANVQAGEMQVAAPGLPVHGRYVMVSVSDNGIGMDAETQSRIFEPFFTTKETGKGTGLGLSTVYGIVKQSGGYIGVASAPAKGTTIRIYMPSVTDPPELTADGPSAAADAITRGTETILVVDDEAAVRALVRDVLRNSGYRVLEAAQGEEAMDLVLRGKKGVDLVVADVAMPRMGGRLLAEQLARFRPHVKVLFMSGLMEWATFQHQASNSETPFLMKPFTPVALTRKVRELLDSA